ncbi:MAG: hypothetical protein ABIF12_01700 [bacterium]
MKKLFFVTLFFLLISLHNKTNAFTVTIQKDSSITDSNILVKVSIDGIPRTIGTNNFQDITKMPFETTILQKSELEINATIGSVKIQKKYTVNKAQIFTITKKNSTYIIE